MEANEGAIGFQALVLIRWLHFVAVFVLFGAAFFWFYTPGPLPRTRRATGRLLSVAAVAAALAGLGWIAAIIATMAGGWASLGDADALSAFLFATPFGGPAAFRLILLAAALVAVFAPMGEAARLRAYAVTGALLLVDQAWLGHAAEGGAPTIAVYAVHVLAGAAWLGGLPPLLFALREADAADRRAILEAFSDMGLIAVAALVCGGLGSALFHGALRPEALLHSEYGHVLTAKAGLVAFMLVCAAYNRFVAMPRDAAAPAALRRSATLEIALGLLVLAAAAVLGVTPPPG
jgi:putative copper resistance protein D